MTIDQNFMEQSFDTGEVTIKYIERPGVGTSLVLLPGGTMGWETFDAFMPAFMSRPNPIYAPTLRGCGGSTWTDSYRITDMARDTATFLADRVANRPS
jgi:pimeloyl-ACP methyl ester carboxylesterase